MNIRTIHARLRKSDFDTKCLDKSPDEEAQQNALRAYSSSIKYINDKQDEFEVLNWSYVEKLLYKDILRISRQYWIDQDHDDRYRGVHLKEETKGLINPLTRTMKKFEELTDFAKRGLNKEADKFLLPEFAYIDDIYAAAKATNHALLQACQMQQSQKCKKEAATIHKKEAATRYRIACAELIKIWEKVVERQFIYNLTMDRSLPRVKLCDPWCAFDCLDAQFVFVALYEISRRWVSPAKVEAGLKASLGKYRYES